MPLVRLRLSNLAPFAIALVCACVKVPDVPAGPQGMDALYTQYDAPTGVIPDSVARKVLDLAPQFSLAEALSLTFVPKTLSDASTSIADSSDGSDDVAIQGSVHVHATCPGDAQETTPVEARDGSVDTVLGIDASAIVRSFTLQTTACRFQDPSGVVVTVDGPFDVDVGSDVALGSPAPSAYLVRGRNVSGTLALADGTSTTFARDEIDLRVTSDETIEVLLDLATLDVGATGTAVLELRADGTVALRVKDGEWTCSGDEAPCTLD